MDRKYKATTEERLDKVLETLIEKSRSYIQTLIKEGYVSVNGTITTKPSTKLRKGDVIEVKEKLETPITVEKEDKPLNILYEDQYLIVIDKEANLTVHPAGKNTTGTLVNRLLSHTENLSQLGGITRQGIVHRLDKDTSGVMLVAKDDETHKKLSEMFKNHEIKRKYISLVKGNFKEKRGTIDIGIKRIENSTKMKVSALGKPAITHYKVLETIGPYTLLQVELETGRTHQIRVHMAYIGHPVVGDPLYGKKDKNIPLERQFLHSYEIRFNHPIIGKDMRFVSMLPRDLRAFLKELREKWKKK